MNIRMFIIKPNYQVKPMTNANSNLEIQYHMWYFLSYSTPEVILQNIVIGFLFIGNTKIINTLYTIV